MDERIDEGWITNEELAARHKLVESDILKAEKPSDPPSLPRMTLAIVSAIVLSLTLAWVAFLVWLIFKGLSLL